MKVTVKAFATLRNAFNGRAVIELTLPEGAVIEDLVNELEKRFSFEIRSRESRELDPAIKILVNGREITYLNGIKTKLKDGDTIAFIPPVGGG